MITDEQFEACRLAANESYKRHKYSIRGQIVTPEDDWEWHFAKAIFKLAQEVKPLVFNREHGCLWCITSIGEYSIHPYAPDNGYVVELDESQEDDDVYETEGKAIEAANADHKRRVLYCLVNGGV